MRLFPVIALVFGCGPVAPPPSPVVIPPAPPVEVEVVTDLTPPASAPGQAIAHLEQAEVSIDEAGHAWQGPSPQFVASRWIPFSEPVDDVVYVKYFSYPHNAPGARLGKMFCGRTRTARVECAIEFEPSAKEPQRVHRFRLPAEGVQQFGVYTPWLPQGGPDKAVCAITTAPSCWSFDWAGTRAQHYTLEASAAEAAALRIEAGFLPAWRREAPAVTAANIREVVHTDRQDLARIIGKQANLTVHCARLADGELSCYGPGVYGELGDGKLSLTPRASRPLGSARVVDVAAGRHHVCAVVDDGRVACWGALYGSMPLPKLHRPTALPMCPFDREGSEATFAAARAAAKQAADECARHCDRGARDGCMGCGGGCIPTPYLFRHDEVCQEPMIESALVQRGETCFHSDQSPRWLEDGAIRSYVAEVQLTLSPVFLTGITDAISVAVSGPRLCVVRRGGAIACLDDNGKLAPAR